MMRVFTTRKIKLLFIIGLSLFHLVGFSQTTNPGNYLPNITPPSPESFNMTKYGNINVNEFYGKTAVSIPLYTYKCGMLELPISVSHDGCGVKVDDLSNSTGSNWSLDTGGIITRTINDLTDEIASRKYIPDMNTFLGQYNKADGTAGATELSNFIKDGVIDSEVDIFNYSIPGFSGSFYLDENFEPKFTKLENEIKIELDGSQATNKEKLKQTKTFIITTPDGVKYYFGGDNGTESTSIRLSPYSSGITSFFLTKITHPIQGEIYFEYTNVTGKILLINKQQDITFLSRIVLPFDVAGGGCHQDFGVSTDVVNTKINNLTLSQHKFLSRIYSNFNKASVFFNTTSIPNNHNIDRILNSIEVKTIGNAIIHKINFNYFQQGIQNVVERLFLTGIQINKELQISNLNSKKYEEYKFVYNAPEELPKRLSNCQDYIGYYNGQFGNSSLIPNNAPSIVDEEPSNDDEPLDEALLNDARFGNRNPDFNFAAKGILTDVYYPTGGHTHFEYESNPVKKKKYTTYYSEDETVASLGYQIIGPVYETQMVDFQMTVESSYSEDPEHHPCHFVKGKIIITDITPGVTIAPITFSQGALNGMASHPVSFTAGHLYKIERVAVASSATCPAGITYSVTVAEGYERADNIGIRLKKQTDYTSLNDNYPLIKRYYYSNPDALHAPIESLSYAYVPNYIYEFMKNKLFNYGSCTEYIGPNNLEFEIQAYYKTLSSNSYNNYFSDTQVQVYPEVTISYGGDHFENGGVFKLFNKIANHESLFVFPYSTRRYSIGRGYDDYTSKKSNDNIVSGDLIKEITFKKNNATFYKLRETNYSYTLNVTNSVYNLVGKEAFTYALNWAPPNTTLSNFIYGFYEVKTFTKEMSTTTTKEYFESVPLTIADDSPYKKITTTQTYEYGSLKGLPTIVTTNTSDSAIVNKTVNTYVDTAGALPNIPSNQNAIYTSLSAQNRVGSTVQTQQFITTGLLNTELLSTQRTLFNNFTVNGVTKILPEKIQISKGVNPLEDKAVFYNYDEHFNAVVMGYKDAPKTRYLFNDEDLVVAKIENYTGTTTTFPVIIGNIDNSSCALQNQYPNALVTVYQYNLITKKVIQTTDPNCRNTFYDYDDLHRLKVIRDHDGNMIKELDTNYRPQ